MPHLTLTFSPQGPLIDMVVGVSEARGDALRMVGNPVPAPIRCRGLLDTGASSSCVDPRILKQLGLHPTGNVAVHTPSTAGTAHYANQFDISLGVFSNNKIAVLGSLAVIESSLASQGIDALIGRDVLADCILIYNGQVNIFSLAF